MESAIKMDYIINCFEAIRTEITNVKAQSIRDEAVMNMVKIHFPVLYKNLTNIRQKNIDAFVAITESIDIQIGLKQLQ